MTTVTSQTKYDPILSHKYLINITTLPHVPNLEISIARVACCSAASDNFDWRRCNKTHHIPWIRSLTAISSRSVQIIQNIPLNVMAIVIYFVKMQPTVSYLPVFSKQ